MNTEAKVISAVCKNKDLGNVVQQNIDEMFTAYADVWKGIKDFRRKYGDTPNAQWLRETYGDIELYEPTQDTQVYVDQLKEEFIGSQIRQLFLKEGKRLNETSSLYVLEQIQSELSRLNKFTNSIRDLDITDINAAEKYYKALAERTMEMGGTPGIPTGFKSIDVSYPTGMAPGHLIVVIGWPGRGKTWFTSYLACRAFDQGYHPLILSLEMSPENMRDRIYTMMGSGLFRNSEFQRGEVSLDDFRSWGGKKMAGKKPFTIVSSEGQSDVTPDHVQAKIDQYRPDFVICDYHQLFDDNEHSRSEVERNRNISRQFKQLALRNALPVVDITAATMDDISDQDSPPMLSQVAWSKAIEYDADMAMAVHKQQDSSIIEVVSRKNRHGGDFALFLDWDFDKGIISELHESD